MFAADVALKINAACKGSNVTPLDEQNQRIFEDVVDLNQSPIFLNVELKNGNIYSYPNRNIERITSKPQQCTDLLNVEDIIEGLFVDIFSQEFEQAEANAKTDFEANAKTDFEADLLDGFDEDEQAELLEEFAEIDLEYEDALHEIDAMY